ncbi:UNVERIFIED_CONTAM: hypothetical protein HDU68_005968 [Siphonaria sp. JEL0065]|nr:hypothetical protein HDU68_005968 [Siphonaria sp. JEL0065]
MSESVTRTVDADRIDNNQMRAGNIPISNEFVDSEEEMEDEEMKQEQEMEREEEESKEQQGSGTEEEVAEEMMHENDDREEDEMDDASFEVAEILAGRRADLQCCSKSNGDY